MKRVGLFSVFYVIVLLSNAQTKDTIVEKYSNYITKENLSKNLHVIASDEYEGRETGKKGQKMAAGYIAEQFKELGIPPLKDSSYYQQIPLSLYLAEGVNIRLNGKKYEFMKDYYYFPGMENQKIESKQVLFLGYGIDDKLYSDYKGKKTKNKVLIIFSGEPYNKDSISRITGTKEPSEWTVNYRKKRDLAEEKGVRALLVVDENIEANINKSRHFIETPIMRLDKKEIKNTAKQITPVIFISKQMANDILGVKGMTTEIIKRDMAQKTPPVSVKVKIPERIVIDINKQVQKINSENVLGYIEGTDLKNELVVVTAHYDHLGVDGDKIYNGADDDGSGTVAVIELAGAFMKAKKEGHCPRRSMLFMTVAGEEKGLLGSSYYVENPVFPLANTVADLNIDMIGRLDEKHKENADYIYIIGSDKLSTQLHKISEGANKTYTNMELDYTYNNPSDPNRFYYRSDHYNFAKNNIPVIFYFNGTHADYHKETDEVEKINFGKMEKITRLVFFTAWELANRNERIAVDVK